VVTQVLYKFETKRRAKELWDEYMSVRHQKATGSFQLLTALSSKPEIGAITTTTTDSFPNDSASRGVR